MVTARLTLMGRQAAYRSEFGLFMVDDAQGRVGSLNPGDPGYAAAALARARRLAVFTPAQGTGARRVVDLPAGHFFGTYLVQNATVRRFLARNPANQPGKRPVAFFNFVRANPDRSSHVRSSPNGLHFGLEDQMHGGDGDFNDLAARIRFGVPRGLPLGNGTVPASMGQPPMPPEDRTAPILQGALTHDTAPGGATNTDRLTSDPAVAGTLLDDGPLAQFLAVLEDAPADFFVDVLVDRRPDGSFSFDRVRMEQIHGRPLADGPHTLHLQAVDTAGNAAVPLSLSFVLDTQVPAVTVDRPTQNQTVNAPVSVAGRVTDAGGTASLEIQMDGGAFVPVSLDAGGNFAVDLGSLAAGPHTVGLRATDLAGNVAPLTALPFTVAPTGTGGSPPPVDPTVTTTLAAATSFLYTGSNPVQTGVAAGTIQPVRAAVLRGQVMDRAGMPISGIEITVLGHPEFGRTQTGDDGGFNMAVNGGGPLTVVYKKDGFPPVQRQVEVPWQDYVVLDPVVLVPRDSQMTMIDLTSNAPMQVGRASMVTDADGTRQATVFFPQGTQAQINLPGGGTQSLSTLSFRATEYTVGTSGPAAMPATLPPTSGYTYAVELSADEAVINGVKIAGKDVMFNQPVYFFVENFLNFPVGMDVPTGYYDNDKAAWIPSPDGRVIQVVGITGGLAEVDSDGNGTADDAALLGALGITDAERQSLAGLYQPGQSVWRVGLTHFSTWDCNWPVVPDVDPNEANPNQPEPEHDQSEDDQDIQCGCVIGLQNQTLGESVAVAGTPFTLNYNSDRAPGYLASRFLRIQLSGATIPSTLQGILLRIQVAGRTFPEPGFPVDPNWGYSFPARPNQSFSFTWDGKDAFGRPLQGEQKVIISIGYVYRANYQLTPDLVSSFGSFGAGVITGNPARQEVLVWQRLEATVRAGSPPFHDVAGWSLDVHHHYDPQGRVLYQGDGTRRSAAALPGWVVSTAGGGGARETADGVPATEARLRDEPGPLAVAPDSTVYTRVYMREGPNDDWAIVRVGPDGIMRTVYRQSIFAGFINGLAIGPDGSLYFSEIRSSSSGSFGFIRRIAPNGTLTTVIGTASGGLEGEGIPANQANLGPVRGIAVGPDGSVYFSENIKHRVRRIDPAGTVTTVAGTGVQGSSGDGGPATQAGLFGPEEVALGPDGSLYIEENARVRRVSPDGIITTVAGGGISSQYDGSRATEVLLPPSHITVASDGNLYITQANARRVFRVSSDGILATVAGGGPITAFRDGELATAISFDPQSVAPMPDGTLFIQDRIVGQDGFIETRIRRVSPALPGISLGDVLFASRDGSEVYVFNKEGRHLRTLDALTGAVRYQFTYDNTGRLSQVTDGDGNVTAVERDATGTPTAIVAPGGQRTVLGVDADGFLSRITDPVGNAVALTYYPATGAVDEGAGLLATETDPRGGVQRFTYATTMSHPNEPLTWGRLIREEDAAGGVNTFARSPTPNGYQVTVTSAEGRIRTYEVDRLPTGEKVRINIDAAGARTEVRRRSDGTLTAVYPDGTRLTLQEGPDPRWGMLSPLVASATLTTPAGLTETLTTTSSVTLADRNNPFSLQPLTETFTINGRSYTTTFDAALRTLTSTSPDNRRVVTTLDALGRPVQVEGLGLAPVQYAYDLRGRLTDVSQGTGADVRSASFRYNSDNTLDAFTDPLGNATQFAYDAAGRVIRQTGADGQVIQFAYDASGNVTTLTPPGQPAHTISYTAEDQPATYTAPDAGQGPDRQRYDYNGDRQLSRATLASGQVVDLGYDSAGRLSAVSLPNGHLRYTYDQTTGTLRTIAAPSGENLTYTYDGGLRTGTAWSGPVTGSVSRTYDNNFRTTALRVNNGSPISFQYNTAGLLTQAGDLTLTRDATSGLLRGSTLGGVTDAWGYDSFGEPTSYTASQGGTALFAAGYTRDSLGRITQKVETVGGMTDTYQYRYDPIGQLIEVRKNGSVTAAYTYDANGNRLSATSPSGTVTGTYDTQDRLLSYGGTAFDYTADGALRSKTVNGQITTYQYDVLGNLRQVTRPDGSRIEYLADGRGRRVGKMVNGTLVQGFLYQDSLRPVAELDGSGAVVSTFVYGSRTNVPDYLIRGSVNYRLVSDHLGSVRLVVNAATGAVVQRLDYDEFGNVLLDTNPGFQPFGFAGGLYDRDTGLVRFGARDYDAGTGRWTAKDPIGFGGGDTDLYSYVQNDPVNSIDPTGSTALALAGPILQGFGASLGFGVLGTAAGPVLLLLVFGTLLQSDTPVAPDGDKPATPDGDKPATPDGDKPATPGTGPNDCPAPRPNTDDPAPYFPPPPPKPKIDPYRTPAPKPYDPPAPKDDPFEIGRRPQGPRRRRGIRN